MLKAVRKPPSGKLNGPGTIGNLPEQSFRQRALQLDYLPNELAPQAAGHFLCFRCRFYRPLRSPYTRVPAGIRL
jgi:hypothetical protein